MLYDLRAPVTEDFIERVGRLCLEALQRSLLEYQAAMVDLSSCYHGEKIKCARYRFKTSTCRNDVWH